MVNILLMLAIFVSNLAHNVARFLISIPLAVFSGVNTALHPVHETREQFRWRKHHAVNCGYLGKMAMVFAIAVALVIVVPIVAKANRNGIVLACSLSDDIEKAMRQYPTTAHINKLTKANKIANDDPEKAQKIVNSVLRNQMRAHESNHDTFGKIRYLKMFPNGKVRIVEQYGDAAGFKNAKPVDMLVCSWKERGFKRCPTKLVVNGLVYVFPRATNGMLKKGIAIYVRAGYLKSHPWLKTREYVQYEDTTSKENAKLQAKLADEASLLRQKALDEKDKKTRYELNLKAANIEEEVDKLEKSIHKRPINDSCPVSRVNQSGRGGALLNSPSNPVGVMIGKDSYIVINDINKVNQLPEGSEIVDPSNYSRKPCSEMEFKVTDGLILVSLSWAKKLDIAQNVGVRFLRDDNGLIKGLMVIYPDEYLPENCKIGAEKFVFEEQEQEYNGQILFHKSTVKPIGEYTSKDALAKDLKRLRIGSSFVKIGEIEIARQIFESVAYGADPEDISEAAAKTIAKLKDMCTVDGFYKMVEETIPQVKAKGWKALKDAPAILRSVCKKFWNALMQACGGRIIVSGAELFACMEIRRVIDVHLGTDAHKDSYLNRGECRVDARCGLKPGDEVVVCRYPHMNPEVTILKVVGYTDIPGIIEISMDDIVMLRLDADFDGDHLVVIWEPSIIRMAHKSLALYEACGCHTLAFEDVKPSNDAKCATMQAYLTACANMGDVGRATAPVFTLYSLIPLGAKPDTIVYLPIPEMDETIPIEERSWFMSVKQIFKIIDLKKVDVTIEADAGKRMKGGAFELTDVGKFLKAMRKAYTVLSEHYVHPYETKMDLSTMMYTNEKWGNDGEPASKHIIGRNICRSAMTEIHDVILREVAGNENVWYENDGEGRGAYVSVLKTKDNPGGCLCKPDAEYHGIPLDTYRRETGYSWYDNALNHFGSELIMDIDLDSFKDDEEFNIDGKTIRGSQFRKMCLCGFEEAMEDDTYEGNYCKVSLKPNYFVGCLTIGILHHRVLNAAIRENRIINDDPRTKKEIRIDIDAKLRLVIRVLVEHKTGVPCSDKQASAILYNELARYLLSEHANESTASDLQDFFDKYFVFKNGELINK